MVYVKLSNYTEKLNISEDKPDVWLQNSIQALSLSARSVCHILHLYQTIPLLSTNYYLLGTMTRSLTNQHMLYHLKIINNMIVMQVWYLYWYPIEHWHPVLIIFSQVILFFHRTTMVETQQLITKEHHSACQLLIIWIYLTVKIIG